MTDDLVLYKRHAKPCKLRAALDTDCDCPWRAKFKTHDVDLAEWGGEPLDPRKKRPAKDALYKLAHAHYEGFSPLGFEHSWSVRTLLERPGLVLRLHRAQRQMFVRYAAEHLAACRALLDNLEAYERTPDEIPLSLYRKPLGVTRRLVRADRGKGFSIEDARTYLPYEADGVIRRRLADLVTDGFVTQVRSDHWRATASGRELQAVSRASMRRETADATVEQLALRIQTINKTRTYAMRLSDVVLFGSYVSDAPKVGDVDVAVELAPRFEDEEQQAAAENEARNRAPQRSNIPKWAIWPRTEVMRALRGRSRIDVRELSELSELMIEQAAKGKWIRTRVLLGDWRPPVRKSDVALPPPKRRRG